jgi:acetyl/propionyl-CoA carboxylase alpha subunit/acetyl-CoA carboxylase carboxyltransferase component
MRTEFQRVIIVNRGEPAMRFIHAIREFNLEHRTSLRTIALFTEPDRHARFVREADESFNLGAATYVDERDGLRRPRYLDYEALERALVETRAEAAWAGWGFVAERPEFAEICERMDIAFIGPESGAMRRLGDKICAKRLASQLGIPVVPWGGAPALSVEAARQHAERIGYPVALKASGGAGGRGIRRVDAEEGLFTAFHITSRDAARIFNDSTVFVEQWLGGVRHIEVQIQADHHGTVWAIGTRDCSVQRRFQKLASEAPAPGLSGDLESALLDAAVRLVSAGEYRTQVSVEFLVDAEGRWYFLEANTRLQVEHVVTELTSGLDLVKLELHVALGGRLEGVPPVSSGHAIEVRLNAEDSYNGFTASPGVVSLFRMATGPGLRVDSGVTEGDSVPPEYGSMFAKIAARGNSRDEALGRLKRALAESAVVVTGGPTNRAFLLQVLEREELARASVDTGWLDRLTSGMPNLPERHAKIALLQAAIEVYDSESVTELDTFFASAARLRPLVRAEVGRPVEFSYRGHHYQLRVYRQATGQYRVETSSSRIDVEVDHVGPSERWLTCDLRRYRVLTATQGFTLLIEVDGVPHAVSRADAGVVRAAAPAVVVSIAVQPGSRVHAGDRLAVLEAMKMEMPITAPFGGTVRQVFVLPNAQVGSGTPLVHLDPAAHSRKGRTGPRVLLDRAATSARKPASRTRALLKGVRAGLEELKRAGEPPRVSGLLQGLRGLLLGYDYDQADARRWLLEYTRLCDALSPTDAELIVAEDELLRVFCDIQAVFGRLGDEGEEDHDIASEQYLHTYVRTLESRGEDLPPAFVDKLQRALAHYGVTRLDLTPELRESLLWLFKAHRRGDTSVMVVEAILRRRLACADALAPGSHAFLALLERLVAATQGRFAPLAELGREVHYRHVAQPAFDRARSAVQSEMAAHVAYLGPRPHVPDRAARMRVLVECPHPLRGMLASHLPDMVVSERRVAIEVLARRDYRIRTLEHVRQAAGDIPVLCATYLHDGQTIDLVASCGELSDLARVLGRMREEISRLTPDHDVVIDLHLWSPEPVGEGDEVSEALAELLGAAGFDRPIRRVVTVLIGPERPPQAPAPKFYTFRPFGPGYTEEQLNRGLHPMLGKRLQLWRLRNFYVERLTSVEDVYLFCGVARENAKDERLFALAEVRDATPVRDSQNQVESVPHLERMHMEACTAIRRVQLGRVPEERLHWNRIVHYVRPPLVLSRAELERMVVKLGQQADGLGLEKVVIRAFVPGPDAGRLQDTIISVLMAAGRAPVPRFGMPSDDPIRTLTDYDQKVVRMRQRGLAYPYEIVRLLTPDAAALDAGLPPGVFTEYDLDLDKTLVPISRPWGQNTANVVVGMIRNFTTKHPEGMDRVIILGDPSREVGSLALPECDRIAAAIDRAEELGVPLEWFALSAGAKISMESGTENMDGIALVLRRLIEFTQGGGEVNIIVTGITVGGQPYWNAEATMLMHTRGILIMTTDGAMVLTGKTALDYSGSVSAEDNQGIGGYETIMGPNGQAQYWAQDVREACQTLLRHYDHTYVAPGERYPRRATTNDPATRDIRQFPHDGGADGFALVGDIFSDEKNPGRKKPFDIRRVMLSVTDQDRQPLERWPAWRDAEVAVTWDAHIGGYPVCLIGFESRPVPRIGWVPIDGPEQWTSGTLFPMASKKVARAINAASGNRPLVILANLSGFDGSPESMRRRQLEFGAEIGRAVVNFKGPIVFTVVSRYHGGAFVVFSRVLNPLMEVAALEGSFASVIGGAPAAAVVFAREVDTRTRKDSRVQALEVELKSAPDRDRAPHRARLVDVIKSVRSEKLGEVAEEFDAVHSVHRALRVGSLDRIISAAQLRPYLIDAIERGMARDASSSHRAGQGRAGSE